jgi:hypothetical protein
LLTMRRLAQNLREIRMPADLANRFLANMSLLNAKKRAPISKRPRGCEETSAASDSSAS